MTVVLAELSNQPVTPHSDGDDWEIRCGLLFSGVYKTGGDESLKAALESVLKELGVGAIDFVVINGYPGYLIYYNYATGKMQVFDTGSASGEPLKELPEAEYPAVLREANKGRIFCAGR